MTIRAAADGCQFLIDDTTGRVVGLKQRDGSEHYFDLHTTQPASYPTGDVSAALESAGISVLSGLLYGLTVSNNGSDATNDIDVTAGKCIDSTNAVLMSLSALTKRLDANWAAGTNQGMRNSGAAITDTTYHIYAVCKADGADPDIYAHTSTTVATVVAALQAETGGSAYLYARRIFSIIRASAAIIPFKQRGDFVEWVSIRNDVFAGGPSASALYTLSVPLGLVLLAQVSANVRDDTPAAASYAKFLSPDQTDAVAADVSSDITLAATGAAAPTANGVSKLVATNTSAQIRGVVTTTTADHFLAITTTGYYDTRGRLG